MLETLPLGFYVDHNLTPPAVFKLNPDQVQDGDKETCMLKWSVLLKGRDGQAERDTCPVSHLSKLVNQTMGITGTGTHPGSGDHRIYVP